MNRPTTGKTPPTGATIPPWGVEEVYEFTRLLREEPQRANEGGPQRSSLIPGSEKIYRGGDRIRLPGALPGWMRPAELGPDTTSGWLETLGTLLFDSFCPSRVRLQPGGTMLSSPQNPHWVWPTARFTMRRPVPSGGAMYPTEIYVVHPIGATDLGVFYYYPARHELVALGTSVTQSTLRSALGLSTDAPLAPCLVFLAHRFTKNVGKYGNFAYRLGAVDLGVVAGRVLAVATEPLEPVAMDVDFEDQTLNSLCGIDGVRESIYAVVCLGTGNAAEPMPAQGISSPPRLRDAKRSPEIPKPLAAMHAAACRVPNLERVRNVHSEPADLEDPEPGKAIQLPPPLSTSVQRETLHCRTSGGAYFNGESIELPVFTTVIHRTHRAIQAARSTCGRSETPSVGLYCAIDHVEGLPVGWFRYYPGTHCLAPVGRGVAPSPAARLQDSLYAATVDLERSAFSLHFTTRLDFRQQPREAREYRVQQLFVGIGIEAATRWATQLDAGSHPLHGFDVREIDASYGLTNTGTGIQAQVAMGVVRPSEALEGSVIE